MDEFDTDFDIDDSLDSSFSDDSSIDSFDSSMDTFDTMDSVEIPDIEMPDIETSFDDIEGSIENTSFDGFDMPDDEVSDVMNNVEVEDLTFDDEPLDNVPKVDVAEPSLEQDVDVVPPDVMDGMDDVEPPENVEFDEKKPAGYVATPISEIKILQEDGTVDSLENIQNQLEADTEQIDVSDELLAEETMDDVAATDIEEQIENATSVEELTELKDELLSENSLEQEVIEQAEPEVMETTTDSELVELTEADIIDQIDNATSVEELTELKDELLSEDALEQDALGQEVIEQVEPETIEITTDSELVEQTETSDLEADEFADGEIDSAKVLDRELTPEIIENRNAETEEVLDNYRENLREYGVDDEKIEQFIDQERVKINAEYAALDSGDTESNRYEMPTDWEEVAASLNENVESGEEDSLTEGIEDQPEIVETNEIEGWLKEINPGYDPFDMDSPYCNNCGSCAYAVHRRLEGDTEIVATAENIGYNSEMEALTGMEQISMSPTEIAERLLEQGEGAHAIIGVDRAEGPGHWFNAAVMDGKVVAIDGQSGEINDWPPDYGDVVNWEMSVKKN